MGTRQAGRTNPLPWFFGLAVLVLVGWFVYSTPPCPGNYTLGLGGTHYFLFDCKPIPVPDKRLAEMQGPYHWAGKPAAVEIVNEQQRRLRLHFPEGFPGFSSMVLDATYFPETSKIEVSRDGRVVRSANFFFREGGSHMLLFDRNDYWLKGSPR